MNRTYLENLSYDTVIGLFTEVNNSAKSSSFLQNDILFNKDATIKEEVKLLFSNLFKIKDEDSFKEFIKQIPTFENQLKHFISSESFLSLDTYLITNEKAPNSGELANSADDFFLLFFYAYNLYLRKGFNALLDEGTYKEIRELTSYTHLNNRVYIGNSLFIGLVLAVLSYRHKKNRYRKVRLDKYIDEAINRVSSMFLRDEFKNDVKYYVGVAPLFYNVHKDISPTRSMRQLDKKLVKTHNYVVDAVQLLIVLLLNDSSYVTNRKMLNRKRNRNDALLLIYDVLHNLVTGNKVRRTLNNDEQDLYSALLHELDATMAPYLSLLDEKVTQNTPLSVTLKLDYLNSIY